MLKRISVFILFIVACSLEAKISEGEAISKKLSYTIDNTNPKVNDIFHIQFNSLEDLELVLNLDKDLEFKGSKGKCKKIEDHLECRVEKSKVTEITLKALSHGLMLSDLHLKGSKKTLKTISIEVKRDYIPTIDFQFNTKKNEVLSNAFYEYNIELNSSDSNQTLKDIKLSIHTVSNDNFKLIEFHGKGWSCKQQDRVLFCKLSSLDKNSSSKLRLKVLSPEYSTSIVTKATIEPNLLKKSLESEVDVIRADFDMDNEKEFIKDFSSKINGRKIEIGDSYLCYKDEKEVCEDKTPLSRSILYMSKKRASTAQLKLKKGDKILYAKLVWMGKVDKNVDFEKIKDAYKIRFKSKKDSKFHTFESKLIDFNWKNDTDFLYYQASVDISKYIKRYRDGEYRVSDLVCSEGYGGDASWRLFIVVKNDQDSKKDILFYNGFESIWSSRYKLSQDFSKSVDIDIDPNNKSNNEISIFSLDGDDNYKDKIKIISRSDDNLYTKNDILANRESVDIKIKGLKFKKPISKLRISSTGDKVFLGYITLVQE